MGASITLAGESLIAQKQGAGEKLDIARFVLALVPGLDPNAPVDRSAGKPPADQIVYTKVYDRKGYVSPNQVIYSLMVGSDVGDWDFNWIGLEAAEGVLLAVATVPVQQKRKNIPPLQIGNNVTRNFLVEFNGAQALTGVTVDASTWQHDFTVRLNGIDRRERMSNRDVFGRVCYLANSLQMERNGFGLYQLKAGTAYVEGIRVELPEPVQVQLPALPAKAWLDVALAREGSDTVAVWKVVFGEAQTDYADSNGTAHYVVELASVAVSGDITDQRQSEPITDALVKRIALRDGDYEGLRARATTKDDVELGNLPNAKSDDPGTDSSEILATTKALKALRKIIEDSEVGRIGTFAMATPPPGWFRANGAAVSRTVYAALFAKIGTTYGTGDGVSTFNLPDPRGKFIRVLDDGRGIDVGRVLGSFQADEIRSHSHTGSSSAAGSHSHTGSASAAGYHGHTASSDSQGAHAHTVKEGSTNPSMIGGELLASGDDVTQVAGSLSTTSTEGAHAHNITVDAAGDHSHVITINAAVDHSHAITINATGGGETRPQNIAFLACIKY
ncbi:phage tail-collar fiber domain-containing protein [Pseudomonas sp. YuFO8]|uniref:phage tail-collar fiber domain-containing protein n=1 Tax=Pseudomonas sp. YuFO8 TaxID=3095361 RepID=UPI002B24AE3D|nr:phage tail protein [Pseudomonas sp. YuFO8]MEB2622095.1 phage tail protein [Pseudomonas sp. YuFO8]